MNETIRIWTPWHARGVVLAMALIAGVCTSTFAPGWIHGAVRAVLTYDIAALAILIGYFIFAFRDDQNRTRLRAAQNDPGRNIVLSITVLSAAAGLAGAISILGKGPSVRTAAELGFAIGVAIGGAVIGWSLTHATYALRYAHLFYRDDGTPCDGLTFPETPEPDDYDFLYFSFVIGMTFQVSDVQVNDPGIRRMVLAHGIVSFAYNTAILALGINLISNLLH
ncbi:MAG TPA: DUF1345 domain-containing protein [Candidatus Baltobacteraceae bacterium]|jgi:uncharacterized membrane protein